VKCSGSDGGGWARLLRPDFIEQQSLRGICYAASLSKSGNALELYLSGEEWAMQAFGLSVLISVVGALVVGPTSAVAADTAQACSEPTRAVCVISDAGTSIAKDRDGDYTTATTSEDVAAFWAVDNNTDQTQTVRVRLVLDGPGTSEDLTLIDGWEMAPGEIRQGTIELFKVHKKNTPKGDYTWTVNASGTESVSATSTFTVY
jgi:hypothetical protein